MTYVVGRNSGSGKELVQAPLGGRRASVDAMRNSVPYVPFALGLWLYAAQLVARVRSLRLEVRVPRRIVIVNPVVDMTCG